MPTSVAYWDGLVGQRVVSDIRNALYSHISDSPSASSLNARPAS